MAMTAQTWSINALATELQIDRRTLAKKLDRLRPAEERDVGGRIEKRWRLADVLSHLRARRSNSSRGDEEAIASLDEELKVFVCEFLYPRVIESPRFRGFLSGYGLRELGLSKSQALDLAGMASFGLLRAICESFGDEHLEFDVDEKTEFYRWGQAKKDGTTAEYLAKRWPDKPAAKKPSRKKAA